MARPHTRFLLVEGKEDQYAIAGLMSHHVAWGAAERDWPVKIECAGSVTELLNEQYINLSLKRSGLTALGLMVDANECFEGRWQRIRQLLSGACPAVPGALDPQGLILDGKEGIRLGVWIMPDNRSRGMLETFLAFMRPAQAESLWEYAQESAAGARDRGAPYRQAHQDKVQIHTWLAWQDPPGRPFGEALKTRCLDPTSAAAGPFVEWFIKLFDLEDRRLPPP